MATHALASVGTATRRWILLRVIVLFLASCVLTSCAVVSVRQDRAAGESKGSGDVLATGKLGADTRSTLLTMGMDVKRCQAEASDCLQQLRAAPYLSREQKFSALAEIALADAMAHEEAGGNAAPTEQIIAAYLEVARYAYAYLFRGEQTPAQRALEDRQAAVRNYYDRAVERVAVLIFERERRSNVARRLPQPGESRQVGDWTLTLDKIELRLPAGVTRLDEIVPTSRMNIEGMRNVYGRDGLGAALVAVALPTASPTGTEDKQNTAEEDAGIGFMPATMLIEFPSVTLDELLVTKQARVEILDPYQSKTVVLEGIDVPLAANYTAPYALWLARSGFGRQALAGVFGRGSAIKHARIFMMQPYDPQRLTIVMLHGLASSPEAWVNMANEVLGDEVLRDRYQVWQVYYPTNLAIGENRKEIAELLEKTRSALDPNRTTAATHDTVLIGHSMGGVISRLLVIDSGDRVWEELFNAPAGSPKRAKLAVLEPYVTFKPMPGVSRAIFLASPHAGTPFAGNWLSRMAANLVRLPQTLVGRLHNMAELIASDQPEIAKFMRASPNGIKVLNSRNPYLQITSKLDISPEVTYHSIIGRKDPDVPLEQSNDGLVPYPSAHLPGAESELVITSGHSVQETPEAILEIRRILREHAAKVGRMPAAANDNRQEPKALEQLPN